MSALLSGPPHSLVTRWKVQSSYHMAGPNQLPLGVSKSKGIRRPGFYNPRIFNSLRRLMSKTKCILYHNFTTIETQLCPLQGRGADLHWQSGSCWAVCISSCKSYSLQRGWGWRTQLYSQVLHLSTLELIWIPPAPVPGDSAAVDSGWCG